MARIPITGDVAELIGPAAERVENRSLLLDKFVFHKDWGLDEFRANDAHRWTLLRLSDGGAAVLNAEATRRKTQAGGRDVEEHNRTRLTREADLAGRLAATRIETEDAHKLRTRHTRRFLSLFRKAYGDRAAITVGQLEGRLAINLAEGLIQNAGICLDRLFGLPFIPGSAVKGVCRHAALEELQAAQGDQRQQVFDSFRSVFGTADNDFQAAQGKRSAGDLHEFRHCLRDRSENQKGGIAFLPAYPLNEARVVVDLTNVHHPLYYGGDKRRNIAAGLPESLAEEKPQPNPFPTVEAGAQFAFCLVLNGVADDPAVLDAARRWLEIALTVRGLGAKTAAGYGWFSIQPGVLQEIENDARREAEAQRKATLSPEDREAEELLALSDEQFANVAKGLSDKAELQQRAFLRLLRENKDKRDRWKTWKKKKPDLAAAIEAVRQKLNAPTLP
jgi:CRISPR type III-B/RAMP module RAMP protein Cmr6